MGAAIIAAISELLKTGIEEAVRAWTAKEEEQAAILLRLRDAKAAMLGERTAAHEETAATLAALKAEIDAMKVGDG